MGRVVDQHTSSKCWDLMLLCNLILVYQTQWRAVNIIEGRRQWLSSKKV